MAVVVIFIVAAVGFLVAIHIFGNLSDGALDCGDLNGNATTGWRAQCLKAQATAEDGMGLLSIILLVLAALGILFVLRLLEVI